MPKRSSQDMATRRAEILDAARACFARKGFAATTIADICTQSGISAGGIYIHFPNKHALAAAIGSEATEPDAGLEVDLLAMFDQLSSGNGETSARLDLNLWAEALRDNAVRSMVTTAMDGYTKKLRRALPGARNNAGWVALFEALTFGLEVQRALGRAQGPRLRRALAELLKEGS